MIDRTRLLAIARKETLQFRRDSKSLAMAFLLPVILLLLLGYAITWDVENIATAVVDHDNSSRSRELTEAFRAAGYFDIEKHLANESEIAPLLERRDVQIVLVFPPDFSADLDGGRPARLQVILDGSDANTASIILGYVQALTASYAARVAAGGAGVGLSGAQDPAMTIQSQARPAIQVESRVWYNEELRSRNMIVPGLIPVIMMIIAAMLTSLTIAREWERGTMEQLAATPVTRLEVVIGKLLPYIAIGFVDMIVASAVGVLLFEVPFRGDPLLLLALSFFFLVGALGLGMFISAVARSQLLAMQFALVLTFLPAYLLSGFMFSLDVMPRALRALSYLVPARYFLVVTRGIFLKGVGVEVLHVQGLLMVAFGAIGLALSIRVFRKEIE
jgi:ABC-2 type transport system permease protein